MHCKCGCGELTPIATMTAKRYGHIKGQPVFWLVGHHRRGAKDSQETREKKRLARLGDKNPNYGKRGPLARTWKGGLTPLNQIARISSEYRIWRTAVFERDKYTCQRCGSKAGKFHAHHIKGFAEYPEARYDVENGKTLCARPCHIEEHRETKVHVEDVRGRGAD